MESKKDDHLLFFDEEKHRYQLDGNRIPGTTTFSKGGYPTSEQLIGWQIAQGAIYVARIIQRLRRHKPARVIEGDLLKEIVKRSKKASQRESKRAAGIGTIVHDYAYLIESGRGREAIQMLSEHEGHKDWEKINNGVKKYEEWHAQNSGETVLLEAIIASVRHQFGGKFDHLSVRNGVLILSDYKTSNGIYVDQFIQLASYAIAIEEWLDKWLAEYNLPLKVGGLEILRFGKENGDDFQALIITDPAEIEELKVQAIRCRDTYRFRLKWESDKRFKWNGGVSGTKSSDSTKEPKLKRVSRRQSDKSAANKVGEITG